jgi:coenzyme F420-0:L-glutamate ligase/coenzyme F420-1:gamma-L-glutamate ligase
LRGSRSLVGEKDLFGRAFKMTAVNLVDSLAAAGVLMMGEGDESRPMSVVRGAPAEFTDLAPEPGEARMPPERDLYFRLIRPGS